MAGGRPTALTQQVHDKIVALMRAGNYFETACRAAGISPSTGYKWKAWGDGRTVEGHTTPRDVTKYRKFREACVRAEGEAEAEAVVIVRKGIAKDPKLALEYLNRRAPDRWGREVREHRGEVELGVKGPVVDALDEYNEVMAKLAAEAAKREERAADADAT